MSPVSTSSIARCLPSKWVNRCVPPLPGMMPEIDFRLAEARVLGCDDDVAAHRQLAAAAEGEAAHGGDHRLGDLVDLVAIGEPFLNAFVEGAAVGHFFDIGAGGENFFAAGDDDDPNFIVLIELLHRQRKIFDQSRKKAR